MWQAPSVSLRWGGGHQGGPCGDDAWVSVHHVSSLTPGAAALLQGALLQRPPRSTSVPSPGPSGSGADANPPLLSLAEDYPNGTWLGDENNPEMRVRCAIIPSDMLHISTNCRTAEKMALTLLDYLFHREVQAVSNLSGQGKHGKKQLDPLTIYGIRCECGGVRCARGGLVPAFGAARSAGSGVLRGSVRGESGPCPGVGEGAGLAPGPRVCGWGTLGTCRRCLPRERRGEAGLSDPGFPGPLSAAFPGAARLLPLRWGRVITGPPP